MCGRRARLGGGDGPDAGAHCKPAAVRLAELPARRVSSAPTIRRPAGTNQRSPRHSLLFSRYFGDRICKLPAKHTAGFTRSQSATAEAAEATAVPAVPL